MRTSHHRTRRASARAGVIGIVIGLALALNTPAASADNIGPVYYPAPDVVENPDGNLAYPRAVLCHGLVDGLCD